MSRKQFRLSKLSMKRLEVMGKVPNDVLYNSESPPERKALRAVQYPDINQAIAYLFRAPGIWAFAKIYFNGSNFQLYVPDSVPKKRKRRTKSHDTD